MRRAFALFLACASLCWGTTHAADAPKRIVLIGGPKSEGPARHDYPNGVRLLSALLDSSPDAQAIDSLIVAAYPDGWPADPAALEGASTIVCYFDGLGRHPLLDGTRRARFEASMHQGAGFVALHQASTVPEDDKVIGLPRWLGGARYGMFDRTDEMVAFTPAAPDHPVSRGVKAFTYFDEFYPTFRFNEARAITPILKGRLHVQYRSNQPVVIGEPRMSTVAWAYERDGGGRSFGFSGAHYLAALDEPAVRKMLLNAIFWTAGIEVPKDGVRSGLPIARPLTTAATLDTLTFHRDRERSGWNSLETILTPVSVAQPVFGLIWESPPFDEVDGLPPRLYASPLYVDEVKLSAGPHARGLFPVIFAATSNGFVYAVNAFKTGDVAPGTILWRTYLGPPCKLEPVPLDGVNTGILSTPVIDIARQRLYVTSCGPKERWQAHVLDITSGRSLPGWPVRLDEATFNAPGVNRNAGTRAAPPRRFDYRVQRGALNLSPDGTLLYVTFGESATGWIVAVDTSTARVASAFATVANPHRTSGGIWGAGGPAVDAQGHVYVATGTGFSAYVDQLHDWTQSVLKLSVGLEGFALRGTYTPFNYCETANMDVDLGSGGVALLPDLDPATTTTTNLMVVGGKQGNVYLLDRARMPGRLDRRQPCSTDSASDASLLAPQDQPQFGRRGPLNVFGPYSEKDGAMNLGRSRSVPAWFRNSRDAVYVFVSGSTKKEPASPDSVPPSLARLQVVAVAGKPAHLRVDQLEQTLVFANPGSPVVTSNGPSHAIVWVLDTNADRTSSLTGANAPRPILYALDALSFEVLWKSKRGELHTSGKYNEPAVARGTVFVGTDRIQAFGLRSRPSSDTASSYRDAEAIYVHRCAACHDLPEGRIPPRELIASRSHAYVVDVLTRGAMRPHAAGLSPEGIDAVARYLTQPAPAAR